MAVLVLIIGAIYREIQLSVLSTEACALLRGDSGGQECISSNQFSFRFVSMLSDKRKKVGAFCLMWVPPRLVARCLLRHGKV